MWDIALAQVKEAAQGTAPAGGTEPAPPLGGLFGGGGGSSMLLMFGAIIAIMYFFTIRPNQKREKERREMLASVGKNDRVVTSGGICGTVVGLSDKSVVLRVSDEPVVKMEFLRGAISQVTAKSGQEKDRD